MEICSGISKKWLFIHFFQIESKFRSVDFCGGRKTGEPGEKTVGAGTRTNNKLNQHMTPGQPGSHWWEASALSTAPSLHPVDSIPRNILAFAPRWFDSEPAGIFWPSHHDGSILSQPALCFFLVGPPSALTCWKCFKTASNTVKQQRIRQESKVSQLY